VVAGWVAVLDRAFEPGWGAVEEVGQVVELFWTAKETMGGS
jgi:hypothetical protein